jgi:hypothetical protein
MLQICHSKPRNMKKLFLLSFFGLLIFCSCNYMDGKRVKGNGNVVTRDRNTTGKFHSVDVSGALNIYVKQDSGQAVRVEADENLQDLIEIHEENGTLYISPRDNFNLDPSNNAIKIFVTAPQYRNLEVTGASNIYGENRITSSETLGIHLTGASEAKLDVKAPRIDAEMTGASHISLSGETKDLDIEGSGASGVKCFDLKTENTRLDISGACSAEIFASVKLDVEASGASEVQYKGTPAVTQSVTGASNIRKVD